MRALGLMGATGLSSAVNPGILVAVPFGLLVLFLPSKRAVTMALAVGGVALVAIGDSNSGLWLVERGWGLLLGGCFLALSLRWPGERFLPKGLGAVVGAFLGAGLLFWVRPGDWAVVDWLVRSRIELVLGSLLEAVRLNLGPEGLPVGFEAWVEETVALHSLIFPALLGLASLAGLGLAWWVYKKLSGAPGEGIRPLKEFRFNDQLIWVLILGVVTLLVSSGAVERVGTNAVVFMGALYALRGAAVVLFLTGGVSLLGGFLLLLGFVVLTPYMVYLVMGAFSIGLGDTWLDLRSRRANPRPGA